MTSSNGGPEDYQISPLRAVALELHEMYEELKRAGFSRKEALNLVGQMLSAGVTQAGENGINPPSLE